MINLIQVITEEKIYIIFFSIFLLLTMALTVGKLFSVFKLPSVAGEIIAGLILGPTILGKLLPEAYEYIFFQHTEQDSAVSLIYWLGLILLMFTSGYEADFEEIKNDKKIISWLCIGATLFPLILGYFLSDMFFAKHYIGAGSNIVSFNIVFAISVAVTSLPVISKIFMDLGLLQHRFARIILSTAAIQDLFLWILLSVASSIALSGDIVIKDIVFHTAANLFIFIFAVYFVPKLKNLKGLSKINVFSLDAAAFLICFACIVISSYLKISIMYSSFIAGMIFKNLNCSETSITYKKIKDVSLAFFIPVYFAIVGMRIYLSSNFSFSLFFVFLIVASLIEMTGCIIAMRLIRIDWLTSINLGAAMNARGGPGIVLAAVTYELGIINNEFFCVLIFLSIITSVFAGVWIEYMNKKGKLLRI